jgi:hypothetical protein
VNGDDLQWRRPPAGTGTPTPGAAQPPAEAPPPRSEPPPYSGPPPTVAPPPDWRPRLLIQPEPPRQLPAQDLAGIDAREREARTVTYGIGMVAGAVLLVVLLVLCGRVLF